MAYDSLLMISDAGKTFSAKAFAVVSGGDLVAWASGANCVGSSISTYAVGDISVQKVAAVDQCVGIALQTTASGGTVAVATEGLFILPAGSGGVSGGLPVYAAGYENMVIGITGSHDGMGYRGIGRAITTATSQANLAIVKLSV
jgi:predicted RecA/RadA family phage recombinase